MKKVLSFTFSDFADIIKDKAGQGRKSLVQGRRMAFAVIIKEFFHKLIFLTFRSLLLFH